MLLVSSNSLHALTIYSNVCNYVKFEVGSGTAPYGLRGAGSEECCN